MTGQGLGQDHRQAAAWFRKAAGQGHGTARRLLSNLPNPGRAKPACTGPELAQAEHQPPAELVSLIRKLAPKYELDPDFVLAIVAIESGFKTDAVSPKDAQGLMQLTAATADRFGVNDRFDATDNLHGGMRFLRHLVRSYDGDLKLVLAAYNSGEGTVQRFGGLPPYTETIEYVAKVKRYYPHDRHPVATKPDATLPRRALPGVTVADAGSGAVVPASRQVAARP